MNELQIRLTADIKDLQSAINKAKATLKSFESETATDSEKSNVGFRRKIGLIEQLTAKAKALKVSLTQATNEQQIAKFNAELEQTNIELARLNALGKSFSAPAVKSFDNLKRSAGAASGAAISFGRIIQDAPFGIIGVANNIQNFGEQFSALGGKTATAGQKVSQFLTALIQPANLAILAVSALTAAWQAYSLGVFDAKEATDEVKDSIEAYRKSLNESQTSQLEGLKNSNDEIITLNSLKGIIEDETLERSKRLKAIEKANEISPDIFKNLTTEAVLAGKVGDAYEKVTRLLIAKATAESDIQKVVSLNDEERILRTNEKNIEVLNKIGEIEERVNRFRKEGQEEVAIANENSIRYLKNQNPEVARLLEIESQRDILTKSISDNLKIALDETTKTKEQADELKRILEDINALPRIGLPRSGDREALLKQRERLQEGGKIGTTGQEFINAEINKVKEQGIITERPLGDLTEKLEEETPIIEDQIGIIIDAFSSLGAGIGASLNISNRALKGFVTTLLSATPKIIGAIIAKAQATSGAADLENASNLKLATGNAVVVGTEGAKGLGPVGLALLPVFIAGAVALVSSAFGKAGSAGGSASAGTGSTFTNRREFGGPVSKGRAYIVGERRPELFVPNTNGVIVPQVPSMDYSGASVSSGMYGVEVMLKGPDDLLFFVEQAQIRRNIR
jgi:hypothetical protein